MAYVDADLRTIARELDGLVSRYARDPTETDVDGEEFVTAVLCQIDAQIDASTITIANCGHPPPLLIAPNGQVQVLEASVPASPLGVGADPALTRFKHCHQRGSLLDTDGLIEALDRSGKCFDLGRAATGLAAGSPDSATGRLIEQLNGHANGHLDDDVAIMVLEPLPAIESSRPDELEERVAFPPASQTGP